MAPVALAEDADRDGIDDALEAEYMRAVSGRALPADEPQALYVVSTAPGAPSPDAFEVDWTQGVLTVSYRSDPSGPVATHLALAFQALVEFRDGNADGLFSREETVRTVALPEGPHAAGELEEIELLDGGQKLRFETGVGPVSVTIEVASTYTPAPAGRALAPTEVAMQVSAEGYLQKEVGTRLALEADLSVTPHTSLGVLGSPSNGGSQNALEGVTFVSADESMYLAWDGPGVEGDVTIPQDDDEPWPLTVVMPESGSALLRVGVVSGAMVDPGGQIPPPTSTPDGTSGVVFVVTLAAVAALVGGTAFARRRLAR
jgi:hypothetical protein